MIQSGDGDWIINPRPSGIGSQLLQDALMRHGVGVLKGQKAFVWRVPPRQTKNFFSVLSVSGLFLSTVFFKYLAAGSHVIQYGTLPNSGN